MSATTDAPLRRRPGAHPTVPTSGDAPPDWLLLTPGGRAGRVTVLGPVDPAALEVVAAGTPVDDSEPAGTVDTVVVTRATSANLELASRLVAPAGVVHVIDPARRKRVATLRRLRAAGLAPSLWWHRPRIEAPLCMVRLDDPTAAATALRTVGGRGRRARPEALLARLRGAAHLSRDVTVLATAPGPGSARPPAQPGDRPPTILVTPRYALSRAVIGIEAEGDHLVSVAKVARRPPDDQRIRREATVLRAVGARGARIGAPPDARSEERNGRVVLVEGAVGGRPLDRRSVRRDPDRALAEGRAWLDRLPVGPSARPSRDGRADRLVTGPLGDLAGRVADDPHRSGLVARTLRLLSPLLEADLPAVVEHGDLSHPNIHRTGDGRWNVVDWERSELQGLPLHDLTFLVAYLVESVERPGTTERLARAVHRSVLPHGWARADLDLHVDHVGVDPALAWHLHLACWARRSAALAPVPPGAPLRRDEVLWMAAVAHLEGR